MTDDSKKSRIEYLESQIWLCKQDLALIEGCDTNSYEKGCEGIMYVWSKTKKRMEDYVQELNMLREDSS